MDEFEFKHVTRNLYAGKILIILVSRSSHKWCISLSYLVHVVFNNSLHWPFWWTSWPCVCRFLPRLAASSLEKVLNDSGIHVNNDLSKQEAVNASSLVCEFICFKITCNTTRVRTLLRPEIQVLSRTLYKNSRTSQHESMKTCKEHRHARCSCGWTYMYVRVMGQDWGWKKECLHISEALWDVSTLFAWTN